MENGSQNAGGKPPHLVFLVTEDRFFVSHFLPMARAARELGQKVTAITRMRDHAEAIRETGARVITLDAERRSLSLLAIAAALRSLQRLLKKEQPDILHCIALRSTVLGGLTAPSQTSIVHALTGPVFLGARIDIIGRAGRGIVRGLLRGIFNKPQTRFLFENEDDARALGLDLNNKNKVAIVGRAGVDPAMYPLVTLVSLESLRVAIVARMLWSKGIDVAVEAVRKARAAGVNITRSLYGAPDPSNPRAVPEKTLHEWSSRPGTSGHGPTKGISAVWHAHDVACLPSRGEERLLRTLLEAGASGRAIITTDVPGCRRLVRNGVEGMIVLPDEVDALTEAFIFLANNRKRVAEMGGSARNRIESGFTEGHVMETFKNLYMHLLDPAV